MKNHLFSLLAATALTLGLMACSGSKDTPAPAGPQTIPVASISLDKTTIANDVAKQEKLTPTIYPENATNKAVTWTTSDDTRARVDDSGLVTIIGSGKATITAKAGDKTAQCEVNGIGPDVYLIGGNEFLHKNGFPLNGANRAFRAILMSGDDFYAAGLREDVGRMGGYFKNGEFHNQGDCYPNTIFVSGNDVYTGGYEPVSRPNYPYPNKVAKFWKNGVEQQLDWYSGCEPYEVFSIAVSNGDVYVAGGVQRQGYGTDVLWKNGKVQFTTDSGELPSVFAANGNVYAAGYLCDPTPWATLWVNNVPQRLSTPTGAIGSKAFRVFVSGSDVYVHGFYSDGQKAVETLWKNNVRQDFSEGFTAETFFVHGADVYVVGYYTSDRVRKLYKNGAAQCEVKFIGWTTLYPQQGLFVK